MKKIITSIVVILVLLTISACNESNGTPYVTYKQAIAANDFEAAHKILDQAETEKEASPSSKKFAKKYGFEPDYWGIRNAKLEVLKSELTFIVSQNNNDLNDRIIFLINENSELLNEKKEHDNYCNHVATLAANQGNEELVKLIAEQFHNKSLFFQNSAVSRFGKDKDFYGEILYDYLKQGVDITRPQLGMVKSDSYGGLDKKYDEYIKAISNFNKLCIAAIKDALDAGENKQANQILKLVKKNIKYEDLGDWVQVVEKDRDHSSVYEAFKVTEDDSDIKEAKELLRQR